MLSLFFEKTEKQSVMEGEQFFRVSNNLDSHYYVVERVAHAGSDYISSTYFSSQHPQLIEYYTSWTEKQVVHQDVVPVKNPKQKKGIGGLLAKKNKNESSKHIMKQAKEETAQLSKETQVLYIQLESFSEVNVPGEPQEGKEFMALVYLLAMRVYEAFKCWPQMIPVITESKRYKFIKRGKAVEDELVRLFQFVFRDNRAKALASWQVEGKLMGENEEERRQQLGSLIRCELTQFLGKDFQVRVKRGQEWANETVSIESCVGLVLRSTSQQVFIEEYEISYYHQDEERRQIVLEHKVESSVVVEGGRNNLVIRYLKQFVLG